MLPAKAEWEAGLSADAVLGDQCLSVGLQERGEKNQRTSKGCSGETSMKGNLYREICTLMLETEYFGVVCQFVSGPASMSALLCPLRGYHQ